jgi:hypothetical protein
MGSIEVKRHIDTGEISLRTVDGSVIHGKINLDGEDRVSDVLRKSESSPYLVIFDATSANPFKKVFIVNKKHIVWIEPED